MRPFIRLIDQISQRDNATRSSTARLTEYAKLKDEIANRSALQSAIMTVNIAAVGTLGGFVLIRHTDLLLLLLIPLSVTLGLWWLDHARSIDRIGSYIRVSLWPRIAEWDRVDGVFNSYEEVVQEGRLSLAGRSVLTLPLFVVFVCPSLISIIISSGSLKNFSEWSFWIGDLVLFLYSLALWTQYVIPTVRPRNRSGDS